MSNVDPKKPQSWASLAKNIYQDLPSSSQEPMARRTAPEQSNWRKLFNQPEPKRAPGDWMKIPGLTRRRT
jgi:hypothetical protein